MVGESSSPPTHYPPVLMSTAAVYQSHAASVHQPTGLPVGGDGSVNPIQHDWYPSDVYEYHPYNTPYPSSTIESQPWPNYPRASVPDISSHFNMPPQQSLDTASPPSIANFQYKPFSRPQSSPSSFNHAIDMPWQPPSTTTGLGIYSTTAAITATGAPQTPVSSGFPPTMFQTYPSTDDHFGIHSSGGQVPDSKTPEVRQPQPHRPYATIAPNPAGIAATAGRKRQRDDSEDATQQSHPAMATASADPSSLSGSGNKRRKRTPSIPCAELNEEDRFLVQLKEEGHLSWKDISARFLNERGQTKQVAALQMRYKRLRERYRLWEEVDIQALRLAYEYWEKQKWDIIVQKMVDFGSGEQWPTRTVAKKWDELQNTYSTLTQFPAVQSHDLIEGGTMPPSSAGMTTLFSPPVDNRPLGTHYGYTSLH